MKTKFFGGRQWSWLSLFIFLSWLGAAWASPLEQPRITSVRIEAGEVLVTTWVPEGIRKVTLESRPRLGPGGWEPRAVIRTDEAGGEFAFRLSVSDALEVLRVRADADEVLPASFFGNTNAFVPQPAGSGGWTDALTPGAPADEAGAPEAAPGRTVVESDIWKLRGDTLYFFNQYRGLQVIDVSRPDEATVTGSLALPATGEQMYLLEGGELVLLTDGGCWWRGTEPGGRVVMVAIEDGEPRIAAEVPVEGRIIESRLVGAVLYVASQAWRQATGSGGETWEGGTVVTSIDLVEPTEPVSRDTLWFPGYGQVVSATDRYFFVSNQDPDEWRKSVLHLIDIRDANGTMEKAGTVRAAGTINDKFKIHLEGEVLTVISEMLTATLHTRLETFSVADPAVPVKLGELELGLSERLFATRFDGERVYVVTFFVRFQMDPLWVVDLSDPANPRVAGELEVPGWSTFLYPLGDRLVAAGIETNQTTVSLFDVRDPDRPALLKRVPLGTGWSWSEANQDEKAFQVLPDDGLVLVPYQSWEDDTWRSRVQLIDLLPDTLEARGVIEHGMAPRRATVHRDRVLSISGQELLSVSIEDRDRPEIMAEIELAWPVDQVLVHGDYLLELSRGRLGWNDPARPGIRVALADAPGIVLGTFWPTRELPILGATVHEELLYLVQGVEGGGSIEVPQSDATEGGELVPNLFLTIYDIADLPAIIEVGAVEVALEPLGWNAEFRLDWLRPGLLLLTGGGNVYWNLWIDWPMIGGLDIAGPSLWWPYPQDGNGGRLIAFDVSEPSEARLRSAIDLGLDGKWHFSRVQLVDGLVYLSHQVAEPAPPIEVLDEASGELRTIEAPSWMWVQRSYLNVVDYTDPGDPLIRRAIEIPGSLTGVSHGGAVLYTIGARWEPDENWSWDGTEWIDAVAYDGVLVHLVDSIELPNVWPRPSLVHEGTVFLGVPGEVTSTEGTLESWRLSDEGRFTVIAKVALDPRVERLHAFDSLLLSQRGGEVFMFDVTDPAAIDRIGGDVPPGCFWVELDRAVGSVEDGIWAPLGLNGVWRLERD